MAYTPLIGTIIFAVLGVIIGAIFVFFYGKNYMNMTKRESITLIITLTIVATFCCWLFWICVYLMHLHPLVSPIHADVD